MNEVSKTAGTVLKNAAVVLLGGIAMMAALLGLGSATAAADKLECNSDKTVRQLSDSTYTCWGADPTVYFYPTQEDAGSSGRNEVRERPRGVAGGGNSETRESVKFVPPVLAKPFTGNFGDDYNQIRNKFTPNGVLVPGFGRR